MNLAYFIWDPLPYPFNFNLPLLGRPLLWYGLLFALGFLIGYALLLYILKRECHRNRFSLKPSQIAEKLSFSIVIGTLIGARLADLLFYQDLHHLLRHPLSLIAIWEGGLASHGGAVGILVALLLMSKRTRLRFWTLVDLIVIPVSLAAVCIRVGNFFNQEILGTPTSLPWGVLFLHPADGGAILPRHPAQLYEACVYLGVFFILLAYYKKKDPLRFAGRLTGLFLLLVFGARFFIEYVKMEQSLHLTIRFLTMGQLLSIPFILLGGWLFYNTSAAKAASSERSVRSR